MKKQSKQGYLKGINYISEEAKNILDIELDNQLAEELIERSNERKSKLMDMAINFELIKNGLVTIPN